MTTAIKNHRIPKGLISSHQTAVQEAFLEGTEHLQVRALAGTGKTTLLQHLASFTEAGTDTVTYLAFGKRNAKEGEKRMPQHVDSCTAHAFCNRYLSKRLGRTPLDKDKTWKILDLIYPDHRDQARKKMRSEVRQLVALAKNYALSPDDGVALKAIVTGEAALFDVTDGEIQNLVALAQETLQLSLPGAKLMEDEMELPPMMDFDDMVWWPVMLKAPPPKIDVVLADESQDFNLCQLWLLRALAERGSRIVAVGDPWQAMYAFRGADAAAYEKISQMLSEQKAGSRELPLPTNYRCGSTIIEYVRANTHVKDILARPNAPPGCVRRHADYQDVLDDLLATDEDTSTTVLCRTNYPLVRCALDLIRRGARKLSLVGRDVSTRLTSIVSAVVGRAYQMDRDRFLRELASYWEKQSTKLMEKDDKQQLADMEDYVNCLVALAERHSNSAGITTEIRNLFIGNDDDIPPGTLLLCSGHRSKGLEWDKVHLIRHDLMPHPMAKTKVQQVQEENIKYVAYTRARHDLVICDDQQPAKPK